MTQKCKAAEYWSGCGCFVPAHLKALLLKKGCRGAIADHEIRQLRCAMSLAPCIATDQ